MTNFIKYFARIQLLLGTLGSIYLSYSKGYILVDSYFDEYERSWLVTIGIFTVSMFGVIALYILLYSMYKIISDQYLLLYELNNGSSDELVRKNSYWNNIKNINENKHNSIKEDE